MSDILREIDEEVRHERYLKLWKTYGNYVIGFFVFVVLAVGGWQAWKAYEVNQRHEVAETYAAAIQAGDSQSKLAALDAISDPSSQGYGLLAAFEQAKLLISEGDLDAGLSIYDEIAASAPSESLADLALLLKAQTSLGVKPAEEIEAYLQPISAPNRDFAIPALELLALTALQRGDASSARERLQAILDEVSAPLSARERASQILSVLPE